MDIGLFLQRLRMQPERPERAPPTPKAQPKAPPPPVDLLSFRADPSKLECPQARRDLPRQTEDGLAPVADVLRAPGLVLARWRTYEEQTKKSARDQAKRLCRQLSRERWPELYAAFLQSLARAREGRPHQWSVRDQKLSPRWHHEPWYAIDPDDLRFPGELEQTGLSRVQSELDRIRRLGFDNLALQYDWIAPCPALGRLLDRASILDIHVAMGIDLHAASIARQTVDAAFLSLVLDALAREVNQGVLGALAHQVDRWRSPLKSDTRAHALYGLIHLFVHLLAPRDILIPELRDASTRWMSEGDLVHWTEGSTGLSEAVENDDAARLRTVVERMPVALSNSGLLVDLEKRFEDPQQTELATALLYFMPATPVVSHRASTARLALFNDLRRRHGALRGGRLEQLDTNGVAWIRRRPDCAPLLLLANLSSKPADFTIDPDAFAEAAGVVLDRDSVLVGLAASPQLLRLRYPIGEPVTFELAPRGYALLALPERTQSQRIDRAA